MLSLSWPHLLSSVKYGTWFLVELDIRLDQNKSEQRVQEVCCRTNVFYCGLSYLLLYTVLSLINDPPLVNAPSPHFFIDNSNVHIVCLYIISANITSNSFGKMQLPGAFKRQYCILEREIKSFNFAESNVHQGRKKCPQHIWDRFF